MNKKLSLKIVFGFVFCFIMLFLFGGNIFFTYAENESNILIDVVSAGNKLNDESYLELYAVPTSKFAWSNNGGELSGNELSKAFDRNWNTCWKSAVDNNVAYTNPDGEVVQNFQNCIEITFNQTVTLDRILYAAENYSNGRGYPIKFNVYYAVGEEEYLLLGGGQSSPTNSKVLFKFSNPIECDKLKFQYVEVNKSHKYVATAREFVFLQPESEELSALENLFVDYAQYVVNPVYSDSQALQTLRQNISGYVNYEEKLKPLLDRAESILNKTLVFDEDREFSTDSSAKNILMQNGDVANYARSTLKMVWAGTNRQVTGVSGKSGEQIVVYCEAAESDPLPKIRFSQFKGDWRSWLGGEITLSRGKNVLTFPNFVTDSYTQSVVAGGPIYLVNPYTSEEQSSNVKVYIEGGTLFPVYHLGGDETEYVENLATFVGALSDNSEKVNDMTELVSNHAIMTVSATKAYNAYQSYSPNKNLQDWDEYLQALMEFDGVQFESSQPYYDVKNNFININFRLAQPYSGAAAYAYGEYVGIYSDWENMTIKGGGWGWGYAHEIGHMFDIPERTVSECSNNMISNFARMTIEKQPSRGNHDWTISKLSSDRNVDGRAWSENKQNYLVWWDIESFMPGFWGELDNMYRYNNNVSGLTSTEKQVYFASLVTGIDLSYYFERWGYSINGDAFKLETASDKFKTYMSDAKESGKISEEIVKFWYADAKQYSFAVNHVDGDSLYDDSQEIRIISTNKTETGRTLTLPSITNEAHLGYEIWEGSDETGFQVIGFTTSNTFTDKTVYEDGYVPTYKVKAFDRYLSSSALSVGKSLEGESSYISIYVNGSLNRVFEVAKNSEYTFEKCDVEIGGKVFDYWLVNGEKYQPGDVIVVDGDLNIEAVYQTNRWIYLAIILPITAIIVALCVWRIVYLKKKKDS